MSSVAYALRRSLSSSHNWSTRGLSLHREAWHHPTSCLPAHRQCIARKTGIDVRQCSSTAAPETLVGGLGGSSTSTATRCALSKGIGERSRPVAAWLFGTAGAVALMVTVGGVTRLTKSGLSMTDWKVQGSLPPLTEADWEKEFARYKEYPEWQQRRSMTLDEFKYIFFWEYGHRMLGRALGLVYGVPLLYFGLRGHIPSHIRGKVVGLLALGGGQGLVGWWMVKSGLENRDGDLQSGKEIRVSPYRLAAHLATAFATFSLLVHTGFQALHGPAPLRLPKVALPLLEGGLLRQAASLRLGSLGLTGLAFLTAVSGAFVAGNDAGRCYNHFPKMTESAWLPDEILSMEPLWRNFFENSATVQADHRLLALSTAATALVVFAYARGAGGGKLWAALPLAPRAAACSTAGLVCAQATLGVTTLLNCVPVPLAAAHQVGALSVLGSSLWAAHTLRFANHKPIAAAPALLPASPGETEK